jgi:hypothetical protein
VRGPDRFLCSYHEGVSDTLAELEARPAPDALALWFDLTCPRCAGRVEVIARSGVHDGGRRATSIVKCMSSAGRRCGRSWQIVLEVQACHYTPSASERVLQL